MSEQVRDFYAKEIDFDNGPVKCVLKSDYDALHAEAEALRAENGRLCEYSRQQEELQQQTEKRLDTVTGERNRLNNRCVELSTELEEARGLLDQRIPCDVMLPPASRIKRGCTLRTVLASIKLREDFAPNKRVFTSAPAPEVPDHLRDSAKMVEHCDDFHGDDAALVSSAKALLALDEKGALTGGGIGGHARTIIGAFIARLAEQGERQEAVAIANRGKCAFWVKWTEAAEGLYGPGIKLYTTPQPGPDVRALVEALYLWLADYDEVAANPDFEPFPHVAERVAKSRAALATYHQDT